MRVARMIRLSTQEQARNGQALDRQIFSVNEFALAQGFKLDDNLLFIEIISGRKNLRPKFNELVKLIQGKDVDAVVIDRIDRFSRDTETLARVAKIFESTGVKLYEVLRGDWYDFANPNHWEQFIQAGVGSEAEVRKLSKRVIQGYRFARHLNRPNNKSPFGYRRTQEAYYLDHAEFLPGMSKAEAAERMVQVFFEVKQSRGAVRLISLEMGYHWTPSGFQRWLQNPVLQGHTPYKANRQGKHDDIRFNTHLSEAIVSRTMLLEIQSIIRNNVRLWGANFGGKSYTLSGLIRCRKCGQACEIVNTGNHRSQRHYYINCRPYRLADQKHECGIIRSKGGKVKYGKLESFEAIVIATLCSRAEALADNTLIAVTDAPIDSEVAKMQGQIQKLARLIEEMSDDGGHLAAKIKSIQADIDRRQGVPATFDEVLRQSLVKAGADEEFWWSLPTDERRLLYENFIAQIWFLDGDIESITLTV